MSDRFQTEAFDDPDFSSAPEVVRPHAPLPDWLAARFLRDGERVTWVCGPRFNPSWERHVTHPLLFVYALAAAVALVIVGRLVGGSWGEMPLWPPLLGGGLVIGSVVVLGIFCGYFTRLVTTDARLVILQGREVCRSWELDDLPPHLVRRRMASHGEPSRTLDLDAMKTMLGGASDQFVDAKTILSFGKQLGRPDRRDERG